MKVGVLALQGDVREHLRALQDCGVEPVSVRRPHEINAVDALVIPGGESTTIAHLAQTFEVFDLISGRIKSGLPVREGFSVPTECWMPPLTRRSSVESI
jgi:5'-phosphate synthase pdxT subunit